MIPKASQRGGGQDLATHLLNAFDNEYVEVAEVRGAVADDLHGAFAEWEAIGAALTKSRNYLYSLSINPHVVNGPLTRDQYRDYADRVEQAMGLTCQPRAMVMHVKDGREHCHVIWSRIDARAGKAIHMAFDHQKLMMVTREFARDHGLRLPDGYEQNEAKDAERRRQLSLYEKEQQRQTGLSKEERAAQVTDAWKRSDTPQAFVRALEELGYVLASGDKRPYVLVDLYGTMNALPKMIADRDVRTKDIVAFLEKAFPPDSLPTVDEAKALVAQHRQAQEDFSRAQRDAAPLEKLKAMQAARREKAVAERAALDARQTSERGALTGTQRAERLALKAAYVSELRRIKEARDKARPTGLAAFLGRVTGVNLVIRKVQEHRDAKRHAAYVAAQAELRQAQRATSEELARRHQLQALDADRALRALDQVDARERKSLETQQVKIERVKRRDTSGRMPALTLELRPRGRRAVPHKAMHRFRKGDAAAKEPAKDARAPEREGLDTEKSLRGEFTRAADGKGGDAQGGRGEGTTGAPAGGRRKRHRKELESGVNMPDTEQALAPPTDMPDPHWTELPLSDTFGRAAEEQTVETSSDSGGQEPRIRPSRSSRPSERGTEKGRARDDFERER